MIFNTKITFYYLVLCPQLSSVSLPLHPMIPQMITLYVSSTMPQQHNVRSANPQLEEQKIKQHFTPVIAGGDNSTVRGDNSTVRGDNFAVQLVFLYYILSHQESVHSEPGMWSCFYSYTLECIYTDLGNVSCLISTSSHHWERDESRQKAESLDY